MDDAGLETLAGQCQRFSAFMGVTKPEPNDVFILVMGRTGSGKSTFISRCTGEAAVIGHGLESCTNSVDVFCFMQDGRRVYLIDTPGFNDTNRPDIETLEILATYLGASYANGVRIHGLILLHPISDNRMTASSLRNIQMMQAIYGCSTYENLAVVTTMWPDATNYVEAINLKEREEELLTTERYFGALIAKGATGFRYNNTGRKIPFNAMASAQDIVKHLLTRMDACTPGELRLQRELVNEGKSLGETAAGIVVAEWLHKARQIYKNELKKLNIELKRQMAGVDDALDSRLREHKVEVDKKIKEAESGRQALSKTMQDLHEEEERAWKDKINILDRELCEQLLADEQELAIMENSLERMCEPEAERDPPGTSSGTVEQQEEHENKPQVMHMQSQSKQEEEKRKIDELEKMINRLRKKNAKRREVYEGFHGQMSNVWDGTINGVTAGVASGVIGLATAIMCAVM